MFLKIMSGENAPDGDSRKSFRLLDNVTMVDFRRGPQGIALAHVAFETGPAENFEPGGNCYLLNDAGDTVASFGVAPYVPHRGERGQAGKTVPR